MRRNIVRWCKHNNGKVSFFHEWALDFNENVTLEKTTLRKAAYWGLPIYHADRSPITMPSVGNEKTDTFWHHWRYRSFLQQCELERREITCLAMNTARAPLRDSNLQPHDWERDTLTTEPAFSQYKLMPK